MKIYMIRHGKTAGNLKGRYIGTTDEPLCEEGREELAGRQYAVKEMDLASGRDAVRETKLSGGQYAVREMDLVGRRDAVRETELAGAADNLSLPDRVLYPAPDALYVSPLLRCRQTAELLFPGMAQTIVGDFRECDFGSFENKNYLELSGNADYQAWIDSGGRLPFPGGESREAFAKRCVQAFQKTLAEAAKKGFREIACVVHGGTIMSVLSAQAVPKRGYYDYQVKNGCGYLVEWKERKQADEVICTAQIDFTGSACRGKQ